MAIDLYHIHPYYTDHSALLRVIETRKDDIYYQMSRKEFTLDIDSLDVFLCVETGECFSSKDDIYQMMKNEYTFLKLPSRNHIEEMKEFILISQNSEMLSLLDINDWQDFCVGFGRCLNEFEIEELWSEYMYLKAKYDLAKWLAENNIEWTDNYAEQPIDTHIDFTAGIRRKFGEILHKREIGLN